MLFEVVDDRKCHWYDQDGNYSRLDYRGVTMYIGVLIQEQIYIHTTLREGISRTFLNND